jgi:hypothetical protein
MDSLTSGPLELLLCDSCGLVQLAHSYDLNEMYGSNYGYRSGLNPSMVSHLNKKVKQLEKLVVLNDDDIVLDIGSNDGTLLLAYENKKLQRVGIDPTGIKFQSYYRNDIHLIPDFFNIQNFKSNFGSKKAKIITSISMFYDLENPAEFVRDVAEILDFNGVWHLEQSYMPAMLRNNSYDTICHEHLEYYSLTILNKLFDQHNLKIIDVSVNSINGGSFALTVTHTHSKYGVNLPIIQWMLQQEEQLALGNINTFTEFQKRVDAHRLELTELIKSLNKNGKKVVGYGASTKGNVILQFCGFNEHNISCIAELNEDKYGSFTPGSNIPILPESDVKSKHPDYMLVLPWHFRESIIKREEKFLEEGGKLIFPLPYIEII